MAARRGDRNERRGGGKGSGGKGGTAGGRGATGGRGAPRRAGGSGDGARGRPRGGGSHGDGARGDWVGGSSSGGRARRDGGGKSGRGNAPVRGGGGGAKKGSSVRPGGARTGKRKPPLRVTPAAGAAAPAEADGKVRLNRFLAAAGVCSRRAADEVIAAGRVTVNGERITELGVRVDPEHDDVRFDGVRVQREKPVYVLFNKPKGVISTNARNEPRRRVVDYLTHVRGRVYTVGRLDADSEGLILVTNDGDFAQAMAHPRYGVPKTYAVLVRGRLEREVAERARGGVWLAEGRTGGAQIRVERTSADRTYLKVTIREGKNREVRRVFAKLGFPVLSLKRVRIGNLSLHGLQPGESRFLTRDEVQGLMRAASGADEGDAGDRATRTGARRPRRDTDRPPVGTRGRPLGRERAGGSGPERGSRARGKPQRGSPGREPLDTNGGTEGDEA